MRRIEIGKKNKKQTGKRLSIDYFNFWDFLYHSFIILLSFRSGSVIAEGEIVVNKIRNSLATIHSASAFVRLSGSQLSINGTNVTVTLEVTNTTSKYLGNFQICTLLLVYYDVRLTLGYTFMEKSQFIAIHTWQYKSHIKKATNLFCTWKESTFRHFWKV